MDDNQLIQQTLNGNRHAFRFLVFRYQKPIFKVVSSIIRDQGLVEEIAQETFLSAYKALQTYDPSRGASFSTWLITIARNRCFNALKKDAVKKGHAQKIKQDAEEMPTNAENSFQSAEQNSLVRDAIAQLPKQFRTAVVLACLEGHSMKEIALIEGCSEGTVKSRIHRGKELLRTLLAPVLGD